MKSLSPAQMEARVARFNRLQTYQTQNLATQGIPPGAMEKITARKVYPVMAPPDYQGRSAGAPVKGPRGLIVTIAECEPGNGPGLHRHLNTVENFMCLSGRFEIAWGDAGEHSLVLEPLDMISVPRGENRRFRNISNETGRLLVLIVPRPTCRPIRSPTIRRSPRRSRPNMARARSKACRKSASSSRNRRCPDGYAPLRRIGSERAAQDVPRRLRAIDRP
jgi:mannose-6-phosphate isomerase-like protein (cupin superfamily)